MSSDHKTLPKSSLLRFAISGSLNYLDLKENVIKRAFAKSYNTHEDYYPKEVEAFLSTLEARMGTVYGALHKFYLEHSAFTYPTTLRDDLISWIAIQELRRPDMSRKIRESSIIPEIAYVPDAPNNLDEHDYSFSPLHGLGAYWINRWVEIYQKNLLERSEYDVNIAIIDESCTISWVLTPSHVLSNGDTFFYPLSPREALMLIPHKKNVKNVMQLEDGTWAQAFIRFLDDDSLMPFLGSFVVAAQNSNRPHLIGLKPCLEKIKAFLENQPAL